MTSVNWSDLKTTADDAGFEPLPANDYDVVIDTAAAKQASSGKNMISVQFKVESGPYQGRSLWNQFVISPENANALAFFFRHMAALGLNSEYFKAEPPLERVAADLIGRRCMVKVSIRQWQGQDRNQVDAVAPPAGGPGAAPAVSVTGAAAPGITPRTTPGPVPSVAPAPSVSPAPSVTPAAASKPASPPPPPAPAGTASDDLPF
jgi:Protein of unknown function (DUF669)